MTKKEFLTLKRQIEKLLKKAEDEALEEGVDITSNKFQLLFRELKRKILTGKGIDLKEYEAMEEEIESKKENINDDELIRLAKKLEGNRERRKKEAKAEKSKISQEIKRLERESFNQSKSIETNVESEIQAFKEKSEAENKNLLKEIKALKEQKDISDKQKARQIKELEERYYREAIRKDTEIYELKQVIDGLPTIETIENMKNEIIKIIPKPPKPLSPDEVKRLAAERKKEIKKEIKSYTGNWYQLPMRGLRKGDLNAFKDGIVTGETPSGSGTTYVLAFAPNPAGSLAVYVNTTRKTLTTDYTLSGKTITFTSAPRSGAIIRVDYRH